MKVWILLGIIAALLLVLWFRSSREGFSEIQELTCPDGSKPQSFGPSQSTCITERAPFQCESGYTLSTVDGPPQCKNAAGEMGNTSCPEGLSNIGGTECVRLTEAKCGPGNDTYSIPNGPYGMTAMCIPLDTDMYDTGAPSEADGPPTCDPGYGFGVKIASPDEFIDGRPPPAEAKCIAGVGSAASSSTSSAAAPTSTSSPAASSSTSSAAAPTSTSSAMAGFTPSATSGTTAGSGNNRKKQVFGPLFTGLGQGDGVVGKDSSKNSRYPELIGGRDPNAKDDNGAGGAGGAGGSQWDLTLGGLGAGENSKFLPFSRQPGDMDLIPDPYRVSQQFQTSSYAFKTEPVPFLTDFSAFQK